jgi:hypothetical protein
MDLQVVLGLVPFMDLKLYMEKRLLYSAGMELVLSEPTATLRNWTKAVTLDDQEISLEGGILYEAYLLSWT